MKDKINNMNYMESWFIEDQHMVGTISVILEIQCNKLIGREQEVKPNKMIKKKNRESLNWFSLRTSNF